MVQIWEEESILMRLSKLLEIGKESAAKGMIKAFKENKAVCVVIDQYLNSGIDIEFINV